MDFRPVEQYYKLKYKLNIGGRKIEFFHTYNLFFIIITAINVGLVLITYKSYDMASIFKNPKLNLILIIICVSILFISIIKYADLLEERRKKLSFTSFIGNYWHNKGKVFDKQGKHEEATSAYIQSLTAFDKILKQDPKCAIAWIGKGLVLREIGRDSEANQAFANANEFGYES